MSNTQLHQAPVATLQETYRHMVTAREMDLLEQDFTGRGEAFFHVSGAGHEATAALNPYLIPEDYLHVHYRDKALMLARGISPRMFFLSLFNKDQSHSRGRQMNAHMSAPELNILSLVGPVGNSGLHAAGVAEVIRDREEKPIVLCGLGDGMTQQGEVHEAIGHAVRDTLPVLFLIEDNAFAISTGTRRKTFFSNPNGEAEQYYGIPITRVDGRNPVAAHEVFEETVETMRETREPKIIVFQVDRLQNHTNADDQRVYRTPDEIEAIHKTGDPIKNLAAYLVDHGVDREELDEMRDQIKSDLAAIAREAQRSPDPKPYTGAKRALPPALTSVDSEYLGDPDADTGRRLTMIEAIRDVLRHRLESDANVTLFGEDLEDPKGDVFGITKGLTQSFPGRVMNSPLSESTILGVSVGRALAGEHPVAFLQFADFLPIAYNQIFAELGSMYWRTDGGWQAPVIVMITCGGYRPGLGPFHASSLEALAAHTPGVDVFMPSSAADAAGLLNAAFESKRPTLFFYPKNCLNERAKATTPDVAKQLVPIGRARTLRTGDHITLVGWGNTVGLCEKAADSLAEEGVQGEIIDLRSLVPWDVDTVLASAEKTGRLVVVHEDNHTAGFGAEVAAVIAEKAGRHVDIRRVTRPDTYVPCNFENQLEILPSYKRVLETAVALLGGDIAWRQPEGEARGTYLVEAIGSSPSDESISVVEWKIEVGAEIESGQIIAEIEADKASAELRSPVSGTVEELLIDEGDMVKVGTPIARVKTSAGDAETHLKPVTKENPGTPIITGLDVALELEETRPAAVAYTGRSSELTVAIGGIATVAGSRIVRNDEISEMCPTWSAEDIVKRTGIESRHWVGEGQDALSLAVDAVESLFETNKLTVNDIDLIVCSTGTPIVTTPAMAAMLHDKIAGDDRNHRIQAYDINAACSGYLYGLQIAHDYLHARPNHRVLLVTTEVLSPKLDTSDPATAPIFGDAATATLIGGAGNLPSESYEVFRPVLSAQGENGDLLRVPSDPNEVIFMDGPRVFQAAVKDMVVMLKSACEEAGVAVEDLDLIVPHQANQRIINAIRQRIKAPREKMYSNIRTYGNTSSNTIPICLAEIAGHRPSGQHLGLTAFGGGFTFGGGVLKVR